MLTNMETAVDNLVGLRQDLDLNGSLAKVPKHPCISYWIWRENIDNETKACKFASNL